MVHVGALDEELYAEVRGIRYELAPVGRHERTGPIGARDQRDLQRKLREMTSLGAARLG